MTESYSTVVLNQHRSKSPKYVQNTGLVVSVRCNSPILGSSLLQIPTAGLRVFAEHPPGAQYGGQGCEGNGAWFGSIQVFAPCGVSGRPSPGGDIIRIGHGGDGD